MHNSARKSFDCVENMREIRAEISKEIAGMDHAELRQWFRDHCYSDPVLQRLANRRDRGSVRTMGQRRRRAIENEP